MTETTDVRAFVKQALCKELGISDKDVIKRQFNRSVRFVEGAVRAVVREQRSLRNIRRNLRNMGRRRRYAQGGG